MNRAERGKRRPVERPGVTTTASAERTGAPGPHVPTRTCIGCRQRCAAHDLVRLGLSDGAVVIRESSAGGRGAWIHPASRCVEEATRTRAFGRAFRAAVKVPESKDLVVAAQAVGCFQ